MFLQETQLEGTTQSDHFLNCSRIETDANLRHDHPLLMHDQASPFPITSPHPTPSPIVGL